MARTTYVKRAQQRYATVPVIDPTTGEQKVTPVMRKDGTQRTTKTGKPIVKRITRSDRSKPLPLRKCGLCAKPLEIGQPYKHITPKSGPYGGRTLFRCGTCPPWNVWDYSYSLSARTAQIEHYFYEAMSDVSDPDEVQAALDSAAESIRELAEEKRESASNIEDGFGHATYQSEDLENTADELESWADEVEEMDIPETSEHQCTDCDGEGEVECEHCDGVEPCTECTGGRTECTTCEAEEGYFDIESWREAVTDAIQLECPV